MKSPWIWIIGLILVFWYFSADKKEIHSSSNELPYSSSSGRYGNYDCTYDCSGHDAGYEWAEENGIDNPDDCDGNSNSFIEGCQAYAEEQSTEGDESEE